MGKMFECPVCGNDLPRSDKDKVKCKWCKSLIVPKGIRVRRDASEFDKRLFRKENYTE